MDGGWQSHLQAFAGSGWASMASPRASYGTPAFKVGGKLIARLREDSETLVAGTTFDERGELMAAEPETYFITDH